MSMIKKKCLDCAQQGQAALSEQGIQHAEEVQQALCGQGAQQVQEAQKLQRKAAGRLRRIAGGSRKRAKAELSGLLQAAVNPAKRAVMTKVWTRRRKRLGHITKALQLVIRFMNAREKTTVFRHR